MFDPSLPNFFGTFHRFGTHVYFGLYDQTFSNVLSLPNFSPPDNTIFRKIATRFPTIFTPLTTILGKKIPRPPQITPNSFFKFMHILAKTAFFSLNFPTPPNYSHPS